VIPGLEQQMTVVFRKMKLYLLLQSQLLLEWIRIVSGEAYSPASVEYNHQILTPFSQYLLEDEGIKA
jgi:hypothetical protein